MFKIVYLPTGEIVPIEEARPLSLLARESDVRAYLESHGCYYSGNNKPVFTKPGHLLPKHLREVPLYLLEVVEIADEI